LTSQLRAPPPDVPPVDVGAGVTVGFELEPQATAKAAIATTALAPRGVLIP
jgi:hypothetical protein